jgi:GAF domain-containing protein
MVHGEHGVSDTLIQLADTLVADFDLLDYLDVLLVRSSEVLGAQAGGVMLAADAGGLQVLASSDEPTRLMELYELQRQDGPCIEAHRRGQVVVEHDLRACDRWPVFTPRAVEAGYGAVFAYPLRLRGHGIGALNLFRVDAGSVEPTHHRAAQAFAHMAAIGILQQRAVREARQLASQLQSALATRVVLEQAKGIVAEGTGAEMGEAYQLLRWHARNHNLTIRNVAAAVVNRDLAVEALRAPDQA